MKKRTSAYKKRVESAARARQAKKKPQGASDTAEPSTSTGDQARSTTQPAAGALQPQPTASVTGKVITPLAVREKLLSDVSVASPAPTRQTEQVLIGKDVLQDMFAATSPVCSNCMGLLELHFETKSADTHW